MLHSTCLRCYFIVLADVVADVIISHGCCAGNGVLANKQCSNA
jgi:hypothetical protein